MLSQPRQGQLPASPKSRLASALRGFGEGLESNALEVHVHHLWRQLWGWTFGAVLAVRITLVATAQLWLATAPANSRCLHGLPHAFAPEQQTRVPMVAWLARAWQQRIGVRADCVQPRAGEALSHDNLFHTVLGLMAVSTQVRDNALDAVAPCKAQPSAAR